jgi:hypothetical protein
MRLIDADNLLNYKIVGEIECLSGDFVPGFRIAEEPTVDAIPVRHGEWVHDDLGRTFCSECTRRIPYLIEYDTDDDCGGEYDAEIDETEYCPHCGAIMDVNE